jgi:hypothetical protein
MGQSNVTVAAPGETHAPAQVTPPFPRVRGEGMTNLEPRCHAAIHGKFRARDECGLV